MPAQTGQMHPLKQQGSRQGGEKRQAAMAAGVHDQNQDCAEVEDHRNEVEVQSARPKQYVFDPVGSGWMDAPAGPADKYVN